MNDDHPTHEERNPFSSIGYLLYKEKISPAAVATAIEKDGVYTWDRFGRYILATDGKADDPTSQACILNSVGRYYKAERTANIEHDYYYNPEVDYALLEEFYDYPLNTFGWTSKEMPDFDALLNELNQRNAPEEPRKQPGRPPTIFRLIAGLVVLKYGKSMIDDLSKNKSQRLSEVKRDLELEGFGFDDKTLRKYLKKLPE